MSSGNLGNMTNEDTAIVELLNSIDALANYIDQHMTRSIKVSNALGKAGTKKLERVFEKAEALKTNP